MSGFSLDKKRAAFGVLADKWGRPGRFAQGRYKEVGARQLFQSGRRFRNLEKVVGDNGPFSPFAWIKPYSRHILLFSFFEVKKGPADGCAGPLRF
jgi:hypothetical protein